MAQNNEEQRAVDLFRPRANKLTGTNNDDNFLLRWLRARNLDLNKAEEMLRACLEWREKEDINKSLLSWTGPPEVMEDFTWKFSGYDSEGRPILIVPFGEWSVRKMIENGLKEQSFRCVRKLLEEILFEIEKQKGQKVTQFTAILDSSGLTFWKIAHIETVNSVVQFFREFEAYYPETLHICYIINAPWVFPYIFNVVKPLLSTRTLAKVQIFDNGSKWRSLFRASLPPASLPIEYEGTGKPYATPA